MGLLTSLNAIAVTAGEQNLGASNARDVTGSLNVAQNKAGELIANLKAIVNALPVGDSNIAAINSIITSLS